MRAWKVLQTAVWVVGSGIVVTLFLAPATGLTAFWNVLIPVAAARRVLAPGVWRNICPLGTTAMLGERYGISVGRKLSSRAQGRLFLAGLALLVILVPLRRVLLNSSGLATGATLLALAALALLLGLRYRMKSAWCSGLCPVHPVERLYGTRPAVTVPNAQCGSCHACSRPCPESVPRLDPLRCAVTPSQRLAGTALVGGFAGFVFGWFQVPDYAPGTGWRHLDAVYGLPLGCGVITLTVFLVLRRIVPERFLVRACAAAAVVCYYWYRLPMLFGFGPHPGTGVLADLSGALPVSFVWISRAITTLVFVTWMLIGLKERRSWTLRPPLVRKTA
jgi:hypothetical protein